jgi:hypothetical protein
MRNIAATHITYSIRTVDYHQITIAKRERRDVAA